MYATTRYFHANVIIEQRGSLFFVLHARFEGAAYNTLRAAKNAIGRELKSK
jgi:hypothetical protein